MHVCETDDMRAKIGFANWHRTGEQNVQKRIFRADTHSLSRVAIQHQTGGTPSSQVHGVLDPQPVSQARCLRAVHISNAISPFF